MLVRFGSNHSFHRDLSNDDRTTVMWKCLPNIFFFFPLWNSDENFNFDMQRKRSNKKGDYWKAFKGNRTIWNYFHCFSDAKFIMAFKQTDNKGRHFRSVSLLLYCFHKSVKMLRYGQMIMLFKTFFLSRCRAGRRDGTIPLSFPYLL